MADWATIASFATAGGTLVLAVATFSAVRSSNRSARIAEESLLTAMRPLLVPSLSDDPVHKVLWHDRHTAKVERRARHLRGRGRGHLSRHGTSKPRDRDCLPSRVAPDARPGV